MNTHGILYKTIEVCPETGKFYVAGSWVESKRLTDKLAPTPQDCLLAHPDALYGDSLRLFMADHPEIAIALAEFAA